MDDVNYFVSFFAMIEMERTDIPKIYELLGGTECMELKRHESFSDEIKWLMFDIDSVKIDILYKLKKLRKLEDRLQEAMKHE